MVVVEVAVACVHKTDDECMQILGWKEIQQESSNS